MLFTFYKSRTDEVAYVKVYISDIDAIPVSGGDEELASSLVALFGVAERIAGKGFGKLKRIVMETDKNVLVVRKKGNKYIELDVIEK